MTDPDDFDYLDEIDASGDDEEFFDCHMGNDGQCGAAGSEQCDFECPVMAEIHAEERRRREVAARKNRGPQLPGIKP